MSLSKVIKVLYLDGIKQIKANELSLDYLIWHLKTLLDLTDISRHQHFNTSLSF
jgi:hypothetical protein